MTCALHGVEDCPLCGTAPTPPAPGRRLSTSEFNMAVGPEGEVLPFSSAEVGEIAEKALRDGDVIAAILRLPSGDVSVQVFGPPTQELVDVLEQTARAYRRVLQGH